MPCHNNVLLNETLSGHVTTAGEKKNSADCVVLLWNGMEEMQNLQKENSKVLNGSLLKFSNNSTAPLSIEASEYNKPTS